VQLLRGLAFTLGIEDFSSAQIWSDIFKRYQNNIGKENQNGVAGDERKYLDYRIKI